MPHALRIRIHFERDDDRTYHAFCPALKGLHVYGRTKPEAYQRATEAVNVYMEMLRENGEPYPVDDVDVFLESIDEENPSPSSCEAPWHVSVPQLAAS